MQRENVLRILREHVTELRERFGVKTLALFGSVARNEPTPGSDVDLLVEFDRPVGLLHVIGTEHFLKQLLQVDRVDLVLRRAVLPEFQEDILAESVSAL